MQVLFHWRAWFLVLQTAALFPSVLWEGRSSPLSSSPPAADRAYPLAPQASTRSVQALWAAALKVLEPAPFCVA